MSTEQRRIMLTETGDGRWTAREEPAGRTARGETPEAALDALDDADDERTRGGSAEPLRGLVGLVDDEGAQRVRERSREFREEFNERMDHRRIDLVERNADEE